MANFEGLINQALASQNAADPAVRQRIYQSSRNALAKMLEKKGDLSDDALRHHFGSLENSISTIEARYAEPTEQAVEVPQPAPEPLPPVEPVAPALAPIPAPAPDLAPQPVSEPISEPTPEPQSYQPPIEAEPQVVPAPPPYVEREAVEQPSPAPNSAPNPAQIAPLEPVAEVQAPNYEPQPMFPPVQPSTPQSADQAYDPSLNSPLDTTPDPTLDPLQSLEARMTADAGTPQPAVEPADRAPSEPYLGDVTGEIDPPLNYTPGHEAEEFDIERDPPPTYKRKSPLMRRIWPIFLAIAVLLVILWILYAVFAIMPEGSEQTETNAGSAAGETQQNDDGSFFITLLEPTDLSALVTAGRGSAELVTQQTNQMLRLQSIRQGELTATNAEPILLELERGVLQQIEGKDVTVELSAKSGLAGPAQFAVECDIGGDSVCGRKRFRVGLQPELIVFALDLNNAIQTDARAYLAINTDITNAADTSGTGDAIDIIFVRLRVSNP